MQEIEIYFGILIMMSVIPRKTFNLYWETHGTDAKGGCPWISNRMGRDHWLFIHYNLRFKMKWVLEHVGNNFVAHIIAPMNACLDEILALFKGFNPYGVIMQCKPVKYGSKLFNLAAIIGTPVCLGFM